MISALVDRLLKSSKNLIILHLTLDARLETGFGHLLGALSIRWLNGAACHLRLIVCLEVERVAFVSEIEVRKAAPLSSMWKMQQSLECTISMNSLTLSVAPWS